MAFIYEASRPIGDDIRHCRPYSIGSIRMYSVSMRSRLKISSHRQARCNIDDRESNHFSRSNSMRD